MTARAFSRYPTLIGEGEIFGDQEVSGFPFRAWATSTRFEYPAEAQAFVERVGSAVEAVFAREFIRQYSPDFTGHVAIADQFQLELQAACGRYRIDALATTETLSLAIEIDGLGFHRANKDQVAKDYLRQRRIVAKGHTVIRFTAQEALKNPGECWRQVDAIIKERQK
jgi:very-short-patch-repair endonuclease